MKKRWICLMLAVVMLLGMIPGSEIHMAVSAAEQRASSLKVSSQLVTVLKRMEGFIKYPVWDYSQWSVGYGTRCPEDKCAHYTANGITDEEATALLYDYLTYFERVVNNFATKYGLTLSQHQFDALVSFTYNCGGGWVNDETGYLHSALRSSTDSNEIIYGFMLWCKAAGAAVLGARRLCEANMYLNGVYKAYNTSNSVPANFKYVYLNGNGGTVRYDTHGYDANNPAGINTFFTYIPTGVDANGNTFVYEFAGWFTAAEGGTQVTVLDGSLESGAFLFAQWRDPNTGKIVKLPLENDGSDGAEEYKTGTVTASDVNCRNKPSLTSTVVGKRNTGDKVKIYETVEADGYTWGRMEDGSWIAMNYVTLDITQGGSSGTPTAPPNLPVTALEIVKAPTKTIYNQNCALVDLNGSLLVATYSDGSKWAMSIYRDLIGSFYTSTLGTQNVTVTYGGKTAAFPITVKGVVEFRNYDGKILQSAQYDAGQTVTPPADPTRPEDDIGTYTFKGWDKQVVPCTGNAVYTAVYEMTPFQKPSTSISIQSLPAKTTYMQMSEQLDLTGAKLTANHSDGTTVTVDITDKMVSGFDNTKPGTNTITVTYGGVTVTFDVTIIKPTVTFLNYDGTVISKAEYGVGEAVAAPADPQKPADALGEYVFNGWDKPVAPCAGVTTYTATFKLRYAIGDLDRNDKVDEGDAIYLLRHILFPEKYAIYAWADFDHDKKTTEADAIYLLRHILFPEKYPLSYV